MVLKTYRSFSDSKKLKLDSKISNYVFYMSFDQSNCKHMHIHKGCIPFTCSGMLKRNILAQYYCSFLNGVFLEHCCYYPKRK